MTSMSGLCELKHFAYQAGRPGAVCFVGLSDMAHAPEAYKFPFLEAAVAAKAKAREAPCSIARTGEV